MKSILPHFLLFYLVFNLSAQKKVMTPEVYEEWNKISQVQLSDSGNYASYILTNEGGRSDLILYEAATGNEKLIPHVKNHALTADEAFMISLSSVHPDTLKELKRKKVKKNDLPQDTLIIMDLNQGTLTKVKNVTSFSLAPEKNYLTIMKSPRTTKLDSTLVKDEDKEVGSQMIIRNLVTGVSKAIGYVVSSEWADRGGKLVLHTTGPDSTRSDKVLLYDGPTDSFLTLINKQGEYSKFQFSTQGDQVAFIHQDTTEQSMNQAALYHWKDGERRAKVIVQQRDLQDGYKVSLDQKPRFLKHYDKLIYGIKRIQPEEDSTLLDEEKVDVEIWNYKDGLLHTQQEVELKKKAKESLLCSYDFKLRKISQLTTEQYPTAVLPDEFKGQYVLTLANQAYQKYLSWEGNDYKDVNKVNLNTGETKQIITKLEGNPKLSPSGRYAYWYARSDTSWKVMDLKTDRKVTLIKNCCYDGQNDRPMHPYPSGTLGWTEDEKLIIYDHHDLWLVDPTQKITPARLTQGKEVNRRYRYMKLDKDVKVIPTDTTILLRYTNVEDKTSGYVHLDLSTKELTDLKAGPYKYGRKIHKAKEADKIIYTKESLSEFPDLILADLDFQNSIKISDANPQAAAYKQATIELFPWTDADGMVRDALLVKPEDFDPKKEYPLIVNFYEKSSQNLYNNRAPYAHRSTINYSYYASKGYVLFNPDIHYEDGYPGESCYSAVMASVDALLKEGYIDEDRMGLQGHSWGGYQIAHLLTKTNRFRCAEAGAPVVNMVSAYGGIRWRSGMSRMFQYERTQSRIGYTLWERPDLYLQNSPIFNMDRVETPVLILHNDKDGAVPWYQGIEYFVALRRLGKPAWLLNYRNEPHWPIKKQNRFDFQLRMEQFFEHYLMDKEEPVWMNEGVPADREGIEDGLQLVEKK